MIKDFEDQATFEATLQGLPDASWTVQDLLRCLTSMATSVKVGAGDTIRACMQRGLDPQALGFGDPHWQRGVGARIDKAVDVLREKLAAPESPGGGGRSGQRRQAKGCPMKPCMTCGHMKSLHSQRRIRGMGCRVKGCSCEAYVSDDTSVDAVSKDRCPDPFNETHEHQWQTETRCVRCGDHKPAEASDDQPDTFGPRVPR